jgi:nitrogen fixation NifU-like protein
MSQMYNDKVMEHFINPRNVGEIENADGTGQVGSAACGDIMKIDIKVEDDIIVDVKFKTYGCGAAVASSSIATEMIIGKTIEEALKFTNQDLIK